MALTQSFFPEIRKQMLADSRRRQLQEADSGGIADLLSPRTLNSSSSQKNQVSDDGGVTLDEPGASNVAGNLLNGHVRSSTPQESSRRIKASAVAMAEAASSVEEVVTEEVKKSITALV